MYQPTINRKYYKNKAKRDKLRQVQQLHEEGKSVYDIAEETGLTEYEVMKKLGLT